MPDLMTLDEAITTLQDAGIQITDLVPPSYENALKLGIEAMRRLDRLRDYYGGSANELIPGETED